MLLALVAALAAQSADPAAMQPPPPDMAQQEGHGWGGPRPQIFIAPSGEVFKGADPRANPVADWFARADANHDGRLTQAEFTADFTAFAASLDTNHDGVIDAGEVKAYEAAVAAMMPARGGGRGGHGGEGGHRQGGDGAGRPQGEARFGILPLAEPVSAMDTAGDGRITLAEVQAAAAARFAQLDSAHQGYLTLAGLPKTPAQQMRERMRERMRQGGGQGGWGGDRGGEGGPPPGDMPPMEMPPGDPGQ